MPDRDVAHDRPELADPLAGQPVENASAVAARAHQTLPREQPQMLRGVRDALRDLRCDLLDRPLPLRKQIDDLGPPAASERLRN